MGYLEKTDQWSFFEKNTKKSYIFLDVSLFKAH